VSEGRKAQENGMLRAQSEIVGGALRQFREGQWVTWWNQSRGTEQMKTGRIVEVVPPGEVPMGVRSGWPLRGRDHESYVVRVELTRGAHRRYWPKVELLEHTLLDRVPTPTYRRKAAARG
jgi:hypothetical protein